MRGSGNQPRDPPVIPYVAPPLQNAAVLVTRPVQQALSLAERITHLGGEAILFPSIAIEPIRTIGAIGAEVAAAYNLVIFVSVNAVDCGARLIRTGDATRIAAIGSSTAAALSAMAIKVDFVPTADFSSEALLIDAALLRAAGPRVLIVRGAGGRTLLQESLAALGAHVDVLEVYRRVPPTVEPAVLAALAARWMEGDIDIVTATSVETLTNLAALLGEPAARLLRSTPLVVASARIRDTALALGLGGDIVLARGADDDSLVGALCDWRTRARGGC